MSDSAISKQFSRCSRDTSLRRSSSLALRPLSLSLLSLSRRSSLISKYVELNPLLFVAKTIFSTVTVTKYLGYQILKNQFLKQKSSLTRRQWSHHFLRDFPPRKNAGCTNSSHDFWQRKYNILHPPTGGHLISFPHTQRVHGRTEYADVITKFSRMGRQLNFLTHGASLRAFRARESSFITVFKTLKLFIPKDSSLP